MNKGNDSAANFAAESEAITSEVKVTTLTGPQAEDIMTALKAGGGLEYRDVSVRGMAILEVYTEADPYYTGNSE